MEKLAKSLGIESISRSQVSEMTKGLNEQAEEFRNRHSHIQQLPSVMGGCPLRESAVWRTGRQYGHPCWSAGVNDEGKREVLAIEPMLEESRESYKLAL